jgi:hypothetical protein
MTKEFLYAVKKFLQEQGHKISDEAELSYTHVAAFIEIAVHQFGASRTQAAEGLAYPAQLPKALVDKLEAFLKNIPEELKIVEQKVESIIRPAQFKPNNSASNSAPVSDRAPAVSNTASKGELQFTVTE